MVCSCKANYNAYFDGNCFLGVAEFWANCMLCRRNLMLIAGGALFFSANTFDNCINILRMIWV